jgi:hypothetical protein
MAAYGINLKIDVSKIIKEKMFKGEKGVYLDATVFVNVDEKDQYDNNGMITQGWKDQKKGEGPILGNCKVFWTDAQGAPQRQQTAPSAGGPGPENDYNDDVPFAKPNMWLA